MSESEAMAAHRRLVEWLDLDPCEDGDCDRATLVRALLAVAWLHCPVEWFNAIMSSSIMNSAVRSTAPEGTCQTCGVPYPCPELQAVLDELEIPDEDTSMEAELVDAMTRVVVLDEPCCPSQDEEPEEDEHCCEDWNELSSHYHCGRCHGRSSMMGHHMKHFVDGKPVGKAHFCCPGDCELEGKDEA